MGRFAIVNIGCKVNRVEADTAAAALLASGWERSDLPEADLILVNTCTVTGEADKKCRKAVRQALDRNLHAEILVTGCAAAIDPAKFEALGDRVRVIGRKELSELTEASAPRAESVRIGAGFNTRVGIKIQDGCSQSCTYCIVRTARNEEFSLLAADVLEQAEGYFSAGVNELVLTGINIGAYRDGDVTLSSLMGQLLRTADSAPRTPANGGFGPRIRLSSIEPRDIDDKLIELLAKSGGRLCRHLHVPLQSGSTKVLTEMNRPYSAEWFCELVNRLRREVDAISLSTDIIVGFPGETEDDFEQTLDMARVCGFSKIHVFPYSARTGTPAAERKDQIDPETKAARSKSLRLLGNELRKEDYRARIGTTERILVENDHALTESYHEVPIPDGASCGDLIEAVLPPLTQ